MSDTEPAQQPTNADPEADPTGDGPKQLRDAYAREKQAREQLEAEIKQMKQANLLREAGVNSPDAHPALKRALDAGVEFSADEIRTMTGSAAGESPPPPEGPELAPGEEASTEERRRLATGAAAETGLPNADPYEAAIGKARKTIDDGAPVEHGLAAAMAEIGASKDPRTFVQEDRRGDDLKHLL